MSRYAEKTTVSSESSRAEIERTLTRYGATEFVYRWMDSKAVIQFFMSERHIRFSLELPNRDEFRRTPSKRQLRSADGQAKAYDQAVRQRWRALALVIKAKLEAVEAGITIFEHEFMAHTVMPDGKIFADYALPAIADSYRTNSPPSLLLLGGRDG